MVPRGLAEASDAAVARAGQEGGIYQPYHYEDEALLWAGPAFRRPTAEERELLFGFP